MPIRSIDDLRSAVGKDWDSVSDEDLIKSYADSVKLNPIEVARTLGYDPGAGGRESKRTTAAISNYVGNLQGVGEEVSGALGLSGARDYLAEKRRANEFQAGVASARARDMGAIESYKDVNNLSDFGNYAVGLGIQSAPYLGEAALGGIGVRAAMGGTRAALAAAEASGDVAAAARAKRALSLGSDAGVVAATYPSAVGDVLSNQREQTGGKTDIGSAALLAVPYAALNVVGVEGALGKGQLFRNPLNLLDNVSGLKGGLARTAATGTTTAFKEGLQETSQEAINQAGRMAVDPTEQFFNEKSNERFKESFVGGATLGGFIGGVAGGWRRSESFVAGANTGTNDQTGQQSTNDIQQTFQQTSTGTTPLATPIASNLADQMAGSAGRENPLAGRASLIGQTEPQTTAPITPAAPAVNGGTTDIAQAQAAAQQQNQQQTQADFAAQQQQKEAERAVFMAELVGLPNPEGQHWDFFGKPVFGPAIQEAAAANAQLVGSMNGTQARITRAINIANNQTGGKLVNVNFNPLKAADSVRKTLEKVAETAARFQIAHVGSVEEAAQILEQLSQSTKGAQLEQLNAIHQALTGKDTSGYTASQQTKGATNEQQLQTTTGVGTVPVQGGTGEGSSGVAGNVQPGRLQSLISGSQPQGQTVEQIGQPSGEGIRTGTSVTPDISGGQPAPGQVNEEAPATQAATGQAATVATTEAGGQPTTSTAEVDQGIATQAAVDEVEGKLDSIPDLIRNVLKMVFPKARPQTIQLYATFMSQKAGFNAQAQTYEQIAEALNKMFPNEKPLKASTIKDYVNKDLKLDENGIPLFISREREKVMAAVQFQANKLGVDVQTLLTGLTSVLEQEVAQSEETGIVDEIDLINSGLQIQNRTERVGVEGEKTGKSDRTNVTNIVDENNKADTLNQKYLSLVDEMEQALEANDEERIAELQTEIAGVVEKIRKEVKLEQGRTRAQAGKVKAEKGEAGLTGAVTPVGEDVGERATAPEAEETVEPTPAVQTKEEEDAVQEQNADEGNVRQPAKGGETVGKGNAKPAKPARKVRQAKAEEDRPEIKEQRSTLERLLPKQIGGMTLESITPYSGNWTVKYGSENAFGMKSSQNVPIDADMLVGKSDAEISKLLYERMAKNGLKEKAAQTPAEAAEAAWNKVADTMPSAPKFADLTKEQQEDFIDFGPENWTEEDVTLELVKLAKAAPITEQRQTIEDLTAQEEAAPAAEEATVEEQTAEEILEENPEAAEINPEQQAILEEPVAALPEAQVVRLENHYGERRGTSEFFTKLQADVTAYATKGAQAVAAAIRDIIKAVHAGVLATAMIFNPSMMTTNSEVVVVAPKTVSQVREVKAEVPTAAKANMSKAAQEAYSTIYPSIAAKLKAENKFFVLTDKPNARMFIFNPDGSLFLQKKVLIGKTVGDYYKGNTDKVQNRITPAGLFTMGLRDAKRGGSEAYTAGGYDFGKVFVLDKAIDGEYSVTLFHSVWTKEKDAQQRLAALQKEGAADSRYSFGCINVDKATYGSLVAKNLQQMDGAALFIVPDKQELVGEFLTGATAQNKSNKDELTRTPFTPKTETVTTTTPAPAQGQATPSKVSMVGREEDVTLGKMNAMRTFDVTDLDGTLTHMEEADLGRLERFPGVANAIDKYRADGMEHILAAVDGWYVTNDNVNWDGSFTALNGKPSIIYRSGSMTNEANTEWTTHHEIGHAVDQAHLEGGGLFSGMSLFNVRIANGEIKPMGAIMQELHDHYVNNPDSKLSQVLQYPFNREKHGDLDANGVREEVFAQLWATFNTNEGNQFLEDELPNVYDLMELIYDEVKQTNYAQAGNLQAAQTQTVGQTAYRGNQSGQVPGAANTVPFRAIRRETVDQTINRLPPFVRTPTRNLVTSLLHQAKNGIYASAITEDVVKMASKYMKSAKDYLDAQYARQATRIEFEQRINKILSDYDKLSDEFKGTGANSVNKFIKDSTVSGKWGYYPGENRVGTELFTVDPDMKLRFDAFDESAQNVIKAVFEHGYDALMLKKKAVEAAIDREFADREKAAMGDTEQLQELAKEKKLLLAREAKIRGIDISSPYAYLGRYGDYVVVAKSAEFKHYEKRAKLNDWDVKQAKQWLQDNISNSDHYVVQFAETQAEADTIAEQLHATGNYDIMPEDAGVKEAEESYTGGGDIHLAVGRLRNLLQRQVSDGDTSSANFQSMNKMIGDLYLMTVAESSARKSLLQRKNVAGADDNMMRNLATSGRTDAHFLSTLKHNDAITDSMERMRTEAKNQHREAMPLYNELAKRQANSMEYKTPSTLAIALNRMNTIWSLTFSPAYYLQQTLQTAMISVPYLAGRLGYGTAVSQVNRGYKDMAGLVKGLGVNDHIDFSKAPADVRDMLNKLVGMGKIDISMDADERATADEKGILAKVMYKMQGVNNRIEAVNRSVAAIAAYRGYLARYGNNNTEAATQYAAQVVSDTHGSYDGFNTPRLLAGNIGRVVGQFRRFQIIQLSMLARLMNNAFKGTSADEKMVARKALGFITAQMAVVGGAMAVPFFNQIAWMMSKILGDPDEPDDFEFKLRRLIDNKVASDLLLRGVPAALGVDVSDKLGMGRVASILPFSQGDLTSRAGAEKVLVAAMGPSANMAMKFADSFGMVLKGDYYKGLEMALPNGFANVMKAGRFASEGITMRNGDLVLKPEDFSMVDAAFQAVGLPTNTVTNRQFTQNVKAEYDKFYAQRSADIKSSYVKAYRDNDPKGMADAREEFQRMEDSRVANGYKRQPMSDLFKAPMEAMKRERGVIGGVETSKQNRRFVEQASQI